VGEQLLAVLREALSNIARHAAATAAAVAVTATPDEVVLVVTDNGKGIADGGRRSGLANLERRAADLGGTFTAGPADGGGTVVRWTVPLN
jgi:signal transduction histidine kinase